jgi:tRNA(fMet)-specific endonuclease VapC
MKMTGSRGFLDTSVIVHFFRNNEKVIQIIKNLDEIYISSIAAGELYYGAYASSNPKKHIDQIQSFLSDCNIIQLDITTSVIYGQLKSDLKRKGTPIPENDIWIAAASVEFNIPLFTTDKHFELMKLDLISL